MFGRIQEPFYKTETGVGTGSNQISPHKRIEETLRLVLIEEGPLCRFSATIRLRQDGLLDVPPISQLPAGLVLGFWVTNRYQQARKQVVSVSGLPAGRRTADNHGCSFGRRLRGYRNPCPEETAHCSSSRSRPEGCCLVEYHPSEHVSEGPRGAVCFIRSSPGALRSEHDLAAHL
jgi:hypothetical protein